MDHLNITGFLNALNKISIEKSCDANLPDGQVSRSDTGHAEHKLSLRVALKWGSEDDWDLRDWSSSSRWDAIALCSELNSHDTVESTLEITLSGENEGRTWSRSSLG